MYIIGIHMYYKSNLLTDMKFTQTIRITATRGPVDPVYEDILAR